MNFQPTQEDRSGKMMKFDCSKHGPYEVFGTPFDFRGGHNPPCPECQKEKNISDKLAKSGMPRRFWGTSFDDFKLINDNQKRVHSALVGYADTILDRKSCGDSVIMYGNKGTGKTKYSCAIAKKAAECGLTVIFTSVYKMVRKIKETWRKGSQDSESDVIDTFSNVDILFVDEVGVQFGTEAEQILLFEVLNNRYENMLPTIAMSNLDQEGIEGALGERVFDRFQDGSGFAVLFNWESYRGRKE